ncbi:Outer membrane protein A precursor [Rhodobacteraceae bacterium THAF1]|uniref:OmpA family protein n=1 Tax=Palleronia sp. THAF1 TaxID=2587842 RepID=UPI000F3CA98D|nr:Outer membrane protein A precursor [Palleronia sp. THAF1]VDC21848.1 Outer membrane protein A precursor [Rhodobacteraceae bacterium THAF1]
MVNQFTNTARRAMGAAIVAGLCALGMTTSVEAQQRAIGTIWIDPDGCEHWVRDDGWEGYGSNRLTRKGTPVCHKVETCGVMNTDVLFATDSAKIRREGQAYLNQFFGQTAARAYTIIGHTDSRASDEYNLRLSYNRATAVARYAAQMGKPINDVRGLGERQPRASNQTAAGMQANRRVEIICIR